MPAEAGIQKALIFLGSRLRGNDGYTIHVMPVSLAGFPPPPPRGQALRGNDAGVVVRTILNSCS